ncbi:MAG: serine hydrolase [Croceivirga sp.]
MARIVLLFIFATLWVSGNAQSNTTTEQALDSIFNEYTNGPGLAIAVIENGETIIKKGYGLANLDYNVPVTSETLFDVVSPSKQVTAACIFLLEQEGKIKLNVPIQEYLPEFPKYEEGAITIADLLYQTSGLRDYFAIQFSKGVPEEAPLDNADVLKLLTQQRGLNFTPGTQHAFSNSNHAVLGSIVERVSGLSLDSFAKKHFFEPLGMAHTFFYQNPGLVVKNRALGYAAEGGTFRLNHLFNATVVGDGGLYTNLNDYILWSNNLSTGSVGGKSLVQKLTTPGQLADGTPINYSGGVYLEDFNGLKEFPAIVHFGAWAGFTSMYYKFLNQDLAFIVLSNNDQTNPWGLPNVLAPLFLADELKNTQQNIASEVKTIQLSDSQKKKFCGNFYNTTDGALRSIVLNDGQLMYRRINGPSTPLIAVSEKQLAFERPPQIRILFDTKNGSDMEFIANDRAPIPFKKYSPISYQTNDLKVYSNHYYNKDLDVVYHIVSKDSSIAIRVNDEELVELVPFAKDQFREEHFGYITFTKDRQGNITGFLRNDNTFTDLEFEITNKTKSHFTESEPSKKVLIVTSNQDYYGDTEIPAANHIEEIVGAYDVFVNNGLQVAIMSPKGGAIPIGYLNTANPIQRKYIYDNHLMGKLAHTLQPSEIIPQDYLAVYYSGGGAAMFGVANNRKIQEITMDIYANNGIISAICHGTAGITALKKKNGKSPYQGKKITGFPDAFENKERDYYSAFPFVIDEAIKNNGGNFVYSEKGWDNFFIVEDRIITGQDPTSITSVANAIVNAIKENEHQRSLKVQ